MVDKDTVKIDREILMSLKTLVDSVRYVLQPIEMRLNEERRALNTAIELAERSSELLSNALEKVED